MLTKITRARHNPEPRSEVLMVKICGGVLVENASDDFPGKRSSKIWTMICGVQNVWGGGEMYQRTRSPENFWTSPKELLVWIFVQEKQSTDA